MLCRERMEKRIDKREPVVRFSTRLGGDDDDGRLDKMKKNEIQTIRRRRYKHVELPIDEESGWRRRRRRGGQSLLAIPLMLTYPRHQEQEGFTRRIVHTHNTTHYTKLPRISLGALPLFPPRHTLWLSAPSSLYSSFCSFYF